jgi:hypothetical protein
VFVTPFFECRGRPYGRSKPEPQPAERAAEAIRSALEHDRQVVYVPRWMSFPARLHGAAPRTFALLAHWFGDHGLAGPPGWNSGLPGRNPVCGPPGCRRAVAGVSFAATKTVPGRLPRTGVRAPCASPARHTRPSAPRVGPVPGAARSEAIGHISSAREL